MVICAPEGSEIMRQFVYDQFDVITAYDARGALGQSPSGQTLDIIALPWSTHNFLYDNKIDLYIVHENWRDKFDPIIAPRVTMATYYLK